MPIAEKSVQPSQRAEFSRPLQPIQTEGDSSSTFRPNRADFGNAEEMIQQSLTRSLLRKVCSRWRKRSIHRLWRLILAALTLCALVTPRAFSQYSQPPQTIYGGGYTPGNAANNNHDAIQLANQSDQQLFSEARLFEQQGRSAQAQRIYLELQRRSLIRSQSSQATFNHVPPRGYSSYGSTASSGAVPTSPWTPTTGTQNGSASRSQTVPPAFAAPNLRGQPTAQFELPRQPSEAGSAGAAANANIDHESFSLESVA